MNSGKSRVSTHSILVQIVGGIFYFCVKYQHELGVGVANRVRRAVWSALSFTKGPEILVIVSRCYECNPRDTLK